MERRPEARFIYDLDPLSLHLTILLPGQGGQESTETPAMKCRPDSGQERASPVLHQGEVFREGGI